ncbi:hypothetical protein VIGAN_04257600 [Vigna angularis var. angularis]|uniref:Uncharacterized protein n=1 Tax=Vigna angularis var. angularis TaxID=157739 RepID=A0A0S3RWY8_PHAAN|nr:hypothetical protein VIGAN_04257600 [Vigna angularis var. angularis]
MKLITTSRRNSGELSFVLMKRESKSSSSPAGSLDSNRDRMMESANTWTVVIDSLSLLSVPMFNSFFIFHMKGNALMNLPELSPAAASNALMNSAPAVPSPPRQAGSTLKASLQTLSKAKRSKRSCKSRTLFVWEARKRIGRSLVWSSVVTELTMKLRSDLVLNSWLAIFLCTFQSSLSELKIPLPRKSCRWWMKRSPFG